MRWRSLWSFLVLAARPVPLFYGWFQNAQVVFVILAALGIGVTPDRYSPWLLARRWYVLLVLGFILVLVAGLRLQYRLNKLGEPRIVFTVNVIRSDTADPIVRISVSNRGVTGSVSGRVVRFGHVTDDPWPAPWGHQAVGSVDVPQGDREHIYLAIRRERQTAPVRVGLTNRGEYRTHHVQAIPTDGLEATVEVFNSNAEGVVDRAVVLINPPEANEVARLRGHQHRVGEGDWRDVSQEATNS